MDPMPARNSSGKSPSYGRITRSSFAGGFKTIGCFTQETDDTQIGRLSVPSLNLEAARRRIRRKST